MAPRDREWLLDQLNDQVRTLAVLTDCARQHPSTDLDGATPAHALQVGQRAAVVEAATALTPSAG
jgi:hypothetical protein